MATDKDEWGNIELPGFGDDKLLGKNINYIISNKTQAKDPNWKKAQKKGIQQKTKTKEWKKNQLNGTRKIRANNPEWKQNVALGAYKREENLGEKRLTINRETMASKKWKKAQKLGCQQRSLNEDNFTMCPHCGKIVDNANYKRWHGDNCKLKI